MKKHWVLVGILASSLCVSNALAQHQTRTSPILLLPRRCLPAPCLALCSCRALSPRWRLPAGTYDAAHGAGGEATGGGHGRRSSAGSSSRRAARSRRRSSCTCRRPDQDGGRTRTPRRCMRPRSCAATNVRVWINKAGNYYLIHLPAGGGRPGLERRATRRRRRRGRQAASRWRRRLAAGAQCSAKCKVL